VPKPLTRRGYTGALAQNIVLPDHHEHERRITPKGPHFARRSDELQDNDIAEKAREQKLPELFAYFKIDPSAPDAWQQLAYSLAIRHVPGFQTRVRGGAPVKESLPALCRLYRFANAKQASRKARSRRLSARSLCRHMTVDPNFKSAVPEFAEVSPKRLENLLSKARDCRRDRVLFMVRQLWGRGGRSEEPRFEDAPPWIYGRNPFAR
jgi:hypothetical protein